MCGAEVLGHSGRREGEKRSDQVGDEERYWRKGGCNQNGWLDGTGRVGGGKGASKQRSAGE